MNPNQLKAQNNYNRAVSLQKQGKIEQAERLYREILADFPGLGPVIQNLGVILQGKKQFDEAVALYMQGLLAAPNDPAILSGLSTALAAQQNFADAIQYSERVVRLAPNLAEEQFNLGNLYAKTGRKQEAKARFERAVEINPKLTVAQFNLGVLLAESGDYVEAEKVFAETVKKDPTLVEAHLNLGAIHLDNGRFDSAKACFEAAQKANPAHPSVGKYFGMLAIESGQNAEGLELLEKAEVRIGKNAELLIHKGNALLALKRQDEAAEAYREALEIEPKNPVARRNLKRLESRKIPAWHFEMLADTARNDAYQQALEALAKDKIVLDIGTGSGLLAMMAARAGARHVYACEMVPELAETAREIVAQNGFADKITVISKKSQDLKIGVDLPEKADLLVSEILDAGLVGEGVLPAVRHARQELLKPGAAVIPQSATVKAVVVTLPTLGAVNPVGRIAGFDLSAFNRFRNGEEYARIHLSQTPHILLSPVFSLGTLPLDNPEPAIPDAHPAREIKDVEILKSGIAHAVCFWFELNWTEEISGSSGPEGELKHWGQAVFYPEKSKEVQQGEQIQLEISRSDQFFSFKF